MFGSVDGARWNALLKYDSELEIVANKQRAASSAKFARDLKRVFFNWGRDRPSVQNCLLHVILTILLGRACLLLMRAKASADFQDQSSRGRNCCGAK